MSVFSRHQHFDSSDPKRVTGMQKMAQTMNSTNFNFGPTEPEDFTKKSIRYKDPKESLPVNPKETY